MPFRSNVMSSSSHGLHRAPLFHFGIWFTWKQVLAKLLGNRNATCKKKNVMDYSVFLPCTLVNLLNNQDATIGTHLLPKKGINDDNMLHILYYSFSMPVINRDSRNYWSDKKKYTIKADAGSRGVFPRGQILYMANDFDGWRNYRLRKWRVISSENEFQGQSGTKFQLSSTRLAKIIGEERKCGSPCCFAVRRSQVGAWAWASRRHKSLFWQSSRLCC